MEFLKKIVLIVLLIGAVYCLKTILYPNVPIENPPQNERIQKEEETPSTPSEVLNTEIVSIYFIGQNQNKEDVYKIVKREYNPQTDGTKADFVLNELLKGPNAKEVALGIYTEIPRTTKLLAISNINGKMYIDLSSEFEQGGGTDGLYKRLYQLIKTVNKNIPDKVYLKINGQEAEVIGGEGIMITQPLTPSSLDG